MICLWNVGTGVSTPRITSAKKRNRTSRSWIGTACNMSIIYCERHDLKWDSDRKDECPACENEPTPPNTDMNLQKQTRLRFPSIRKAAKDETCTICGRNDGTTVFAHLNDSWAGKGMRQKSDDIAGFFACQECHDCYDRRSEAKIIKFDCWVIMRAMYRTWRRLIEKGIVVIK